MKKKLYEAPQLAVVALQTAEILLTSEDGLVEESEIALSGGSALVFRKDGKVNVWGGNTIAKRTGRRLSSFLNK